MTVAAPTGRAVFNGTDSAGPFTLTFPFFDNSWITVLKSGIHGVTQLAENFDYVLTGAGDPNGGVLNLAAPLAIGETLYVKREMPLTQPVEFGTFGAFFASTHEAAFDMQTMMTQQVNERVGDLDERVSAMVQGVRVVASGSTDTATVIDADASLAPVEVDIAGLGEVVVIKDDNTANPVTVIDSSGPTVCRGDLEPLTVQDDTVRLKLIGDNWKKI